jgi:hypothetical protein
VAQTTAERALATGQVQDAWTQANRAAHRTLLKIINGGGDNVSTNGGTVTLDLRSIVEQVAVQIGIDPAVANKIPASAGSLVILRSNQIDAAQKIAKLIRRLAIVLTVLVFGLYALAVYLARGRRRETLRSVGIGFIGAGAVALIVHGLAGTAVVDALAKNESVRPAADATWSIGTSLLVQAAGSAITFGALVVIAAVFAGPTRHAVRLRRWAAPRSAQAPDQARVSPRTDGYAGERTPERPSSLKRPHARPRLGPVRGARLERSRLGPRQGSTGRRCRSSSYAGAHLRAPEGVRSAQSRCFHGGRRLNVR